MLHQIFCTLICFTNASKRKFVDWTLVQRTFLQRVRWLLFSIMTSRFSRGLMWSLIVAFLVRALTWRGRGPPAEWRRGCEIHYSSVLNDQTSVWTFITILQWRTFSFVTCNSDNIYYSAWSSDISSCLSFQPFLCKFVWYSCNFMSSKYSALGVHKNPFPECLYFPSGCMYSSLLAMPNTSSLTSVCIL
jgi:hypothetical protein